jgi:hypothetical protein
MQLVRRGSVCLKLASRRPEVKRFFRSSELLKKHAIRGTVLSLVPPEVTEVFNHHGHVTIDEVVRVATDSLSTSAVGTVLSITLTAVKLF